MGAEGNFEVALWMMVTLDKGVLGVLRSPNLRAPSCTSEPSSGLNSQGKLIDLADGPNCGSRRCDANPRADDKTAAGAR
jgi:hypothetical protein